MHTQAYAQVDESLETGWRGALEQWMHCVAKKNPKQTPYSMCVSVLGWVLQNKTAISEGQITWLCNCNLTIGKNTEEKRYRKLSLRLGLPSLRLSFLSHHFQQWLQSVLLHIYHVVHLKMAARCGGGSQMLSQRYRAAQRISVPHNIHKYFSVCAHFQLGLTSVFSKGSKADVNSLNHMPLLMCFTMTTRSAEFEFEAIKPLIFYCCLACSSINSAANNVILDVKMYVCVCWVCMSEFHLGAVKRCMFSCIVFKTILPANSRKV